MNFWNSYIKWTKLLYTNMNECLAVVEWNAFTEIHSVEGSETRWTTIRTTLSHDDLAFGKFFAEEWNTRNLQYANSKATSFFSDESTLLSSSLSAMVVQFEIVQEYCDGSSGKLIFFKSTFLSQIDTSMSNVYKTKSTLTKGVGYIFRNSVQSIIHPPLPPSYLFLLFRSWFDDWIIKWSLLRWIRSVVRRARTVRGGLLRT